MGRFEVVQVLIDENPTEESLTRQWLADRVGVSLRALQEDVSAQKRLVRRASRRFLKATECSPGSLSTTT